MCSRNEIWNIPAALRMNLKTIFFSFWAKLEKCGKWKTFSWNITNYGWTCILYFFSKIKISADVVMKEACWLLAPNVGHVPLVFLSCLQRSAKFRIWIEENSFKDKCLNMCQSHWCCYSYLLHPVIDSGHFTVTEL